MGKIQKIGILTSGGDGPGMNAGIRSVVRYALHQGLKVDGVMHGYQGLLDEEFVSLDHRSVSGIINHGGTILKTARSKEFATKEGKIKAGENARKRGIDGLIVIGGDGSYQGARVFTELTGIPTIGMPGTIDNDLFGTDQTIGCQTAINTALDAIDKIRDTAHSMERIYVVEVMGNKSGFIALEVALAAGAEEVIIPERKTDYRLMCDELVGGNKKGKISCVVIVAEGAAKAQHVSETITTMTGLETRCVILGHVQRGGTPSGADRLLATRLGAAAVELLMQGESGKAVGVLQNELNIVDLASAAKRQYTHIESDYRLLKILT